MEKKLSVVATLCPPFGGCPAIFDDGNDYIIVGKLLTKNDLENMADKIGKDETAVSISKELINKLLQKN